MGWISSLDMVEPPKPSQDLSGPSPIVRSSQEFSASFCEECGRVTLQRRPSGTMCEHSGPTTSTAPLTSSREAGPARTSALQVLAKAWREAKAASFSRSLGLLSSFDQSSSSWKTAQISWLEEWDLMPSSRSWPRRGLMSRGECYQLSMWGRRTSEKGSGFLLPTPTASEYGSNQSPSEGVSVRPSLSTIARNGLLPTPTRMDFSDRKYQNQKNGSRTDTLPGAAHKLSSLLPTPTARDWKDGLNPGEHGRYTPSVAVAVAAAGHQGYLSPRFVEWMMGLPEDATEPLDESEFPPAETDGCHSPRARRSKDCLEYQKVEKIEMEVGE